MRLSLCVLIVLSISLFANPTSASDLYSLDSHGANDGTIYKLNQSTAAESLVGPVGPAFGFPGDLASDTHISTFRIWAPDITSNTLLKIDPTTGLGTPGKALRISELILVNSLKASGSALPIARCVANCLTSSLRTANGSSRSAS